MSMQYAIMTTESAFKTATTSPVLNTDYIALRIDTDNGVYFRKEPQFWNVRSAHTRNRRERTGTERYVIRGTISQVLHRVQAPMLIKWALQPVDQSGTPDLPWTTSVVAGHLGTVQFDGAHEFMDDGSTRKRKTNGAVCVSGRIEGNNQSDLIRYTANFIASTEASSSFTAPAATDYPTSEYVFQDMWSASGIFKVGSATTSVSSWAIDWTNFVQPQWYESASIIEPRMMGRDINFTITERLNSTPDRRSALEARTAQDCEFTLHDGTGSVKFDFHARSFIETIQDALPLQNEYTRTITAGVFFDTATGTDLTLTFA